MTNQRLFTKLSSLMKQKGNLVLCLSLYLMVTAVTAVAHEPTIVSFDPPGSIFTYAFGINSAGVIEEPTLTQATSITPTGALPTVHSRSSTPQARALDPSRAPPSTASIGKGQQRANISTPTASITAFCWQGTAPLPASRFLAQAQEPARARLTGISTRRARWRELC